MRLMTRFTATASLIALLGLTPWLDAQAGPFDPVVTVNDRVITQYELDQRVRFLTLLRAAQDPQAEAEKTLIEDRLRLDEARRLGLTLSDEQVLAAMDEFAGRVNMSGEEFVAALNQAGVSRETYRDFVTAGMLWRQIVRQKHGASVTITDSDIDKEIARQAQSSAPARVLLSELILPAPPGREQAAMDQMRRIAAGIKSESGFAAAARRYSASGSRGRGGRINWLDLANLPQELQQQFLVLGPGGISQPVAMNGAVGLFLVRGLEQGKRSEAPQILDYAQFLIPGGQSDTARAEAARISARVDSCEDLYPIARGLPADQLMRDSAPQNSLPSDIAYELAKLDPGEISTTLSRGDALVLLMLCARDPAAPEGDAETLAGDREAARSAILNRRLTGYADRDLAALRATAIISRP